MSMKTKFYLHDSLKHGDEHEFDESNLSSRFGDFISVHERSHWETFRLLSIALETKEAPALLLNPVYQVISSFHTFIRVTKWSHLHEVLL